MPDAGRASQTEWGLTLTREDIIQQINDIDVETTKLIARQKYLREKRVNLILKAHGIEPGKTIVRVTPDGPPSMYGLEFIICGPDMRERFGLDRKPHIMGHMMRKNGTGRTTRIFPLRTHWEIVTADELAMERV